jgi:hypothetical protein
MDSGCQRAWSGPVNALVGISVVKGRRGLGTLPKLITWDATGPGRRRQGKAGTPAGAVAGEMQAVDLDQLLGYFLLARHERLVNPAFPEVRRLGLYFCRHGYLWSADANTWTGHPQFAEIEEWYFEKAQDVFGGRPPAPLSATGGSQVRADARG